MSDGNKTEQIPAKQQHNPGERALGLTASDRLFLIVIILICVSTFAVRQVQLRISTDNKLQVVRSETNAPLYQLEINSATWVEWMQLDGIGEMTARKIVADRDSNGPFESIADITRVKGIGAVTLKKMEPHLRCELCQSGNTEAPR